MVHHALVRHLAFEACTFIGAVEITRQYPVVSKTTMRSQHPVRNIGSPQWPHRRPQPSPNPQNSIFDGPNPRIFPLSHPPNHCTAHTQHLLLSLKRKRAKAYLDKTNILALLTEALTADVEAVLADQTGLVGADTAAACTLAVAAWARVPDCIVRHDCDLCVVCVSSVDFDLLRKLEMLVFMCVSSRWRLWEGWRGGSWRGGMSRENVRVFRSTRRIVDGSGGGVSLVSRAEVCFRDVRFDLERFSQMQALAVCFPDAKTNSLLAQPCEMGRRPALRSSSATHVPL
jgi:hypothetical protein